MTYTFKLSRRLAMSRLWGVLGLVLLAAACTDNKILENSDGSESSGWTPVAQVEVLPDSVFAEVNQRIQLLAREITAGGHAAASGVVWTTSGGDISADGVFFAAEPGTYKVAGRGRGRKKADTTTVVVGDSVPGVVAIVLTPDTANLQQSEARQFAATGIRSDSSRVSIGTVWTAQGGTIDAGGDYVAPSAPGHYRVIVTNVSGSLADTASVTVSGSEPTLAGLELTPATSSLLAGGTQQFAVQGRLTDGSVVPVDAQFTASGGTITESGLYTAGSIPGAYSVVSTQGDQADTAEVVISAPTPTSCQPAATHLCPGDNLQAKVSAQSNGTAFTLGAGTFRLQQVTPKPGQSFSGLGPTQTILSGAKVLTGWTASGGRWFVGGQTQSAFHKNNWQCLASQPLCYESEMLWVDDSLYTRVASVAQMGPGKWVFDEAADEIWIPIDPRNRTIETSVTPYAFAGNVTGVTIRDLTVRRYANSNGYGAIGSQASGAGWRIINVTSEENHGSGIDASSGWQVIGSRMLKNGQLGYSCSGSAILFEDDTIAYNNTNGNTAGASGEAGGGKCTRTDGLTFRRTYSHHNKGPGLWTDIDNIRTLYEYNRVEDNEWRGIFHEISYAAVIRNNVVRRNGFNSPFASPSACDRAGILVSSSPNVEIYGNTVEGNYHGITGLETPRGSGAYGPHDITNLYVHDNTVSQLNGGRAAGICDSDPDANAYGSAANNRWTRNVYVQNAGTHWRWTNNADVSLNQWREAGQDSGSTFR